MMWEDASDNEFGIPSPELKRKCPICGKVKKFLRIDVNSRDGRVFCQGYYLTLYMCSCCQIIKSFAKKI